MFVTLNSKPSQRATNRKNSNLMQVIQNPRLPFCPFICQAQDIVIENVVSRGDENEEDTLEDVLNLTREEWGLQEDQLRCECRMGRQVLYLREDCEMILCCLIDDLLEQRRLSLCIHDTLNLTVRGDAGQKYLSQEHQRRLLERLQRSRESWNNLCFWTHIPWDLEEFWMIPEGPAFVSELKKSHFHQIEWPERGTSLGELAVSRAQRANLLSSHPSTPTRANELDKTILVDSDETDDTCLICRDRNPNTRVLPCGHQCVCVVCSNLLKNTSDASICVQCRRPISFVENLI